MHKNRSSAFTIVELLVVIVVIGILAAITIISYTNVTAKASEASLKAELSNASKKLAMYYAQNNTYPISINLTTGCPIAPVADSSNCIKYSTDTSIIYNLTTPSTYELNFSKGSLIYEVTNNTTPTSSPNWLVLGTQTWAKHSLNVGTMITGATEQTDNGIIEKYCYNDTESNCTTYGALYQWNEAMQYLAAESSQGICPLGSHIPSDAEWKTLEMHLGMTQAEADATGYRGTLLPGLGT